MIAEVKTLYASNAREIPQMMRKLAADCETPPDGADAPTAAVCVIFDPKSGKHNVYGWGDTDIEKSIVFLAIALADLTRLKDGGRLWDVPTGGVR